MPDQPTDELTPREAGLLGGRTWAHRFAVTADELNALAAGDVSDEVRHSVEPGLVDGWATWRDPSTLDADLDEFWLGFRDGVRAFIVAVRTGTTDN
jgi:hypothetical protein